MARKETDHSQGDLLTPREVASLCGRHPGTVYRWIKEDRLPVVNRKRDFVIRKEDLDACLKSLK